MTFSFRARVLLVVLAVGVAPLVILGVWMSRATLRAGETLLRERLEATLEVEASAIRGAWVPVRSSLLDAGAAASLVAQARAGETVATNEARQVLAGLDSSVESLTLRDVEGARLWFLERPGEDPPRAYVLAGPLSVELPLEDDGQQVGSLEARLSFDALRIHSPPPATAGAVMLAFDPTSGEPLLRTPFDPELARRERFEWNGEEWLVAFKAIREPAVVLAAAAPLALFTQPFESTARQGLWLLVLLAAGGLGAAALMTRRLTHSLERLAGAADAVAAGDLERTSNVSGDDEVGRVARAFDGMTRSLNRTLMQLAERSSLAAVGEFAAALAHEVRNPLTSIKLDLQEVEESLAADSAERGLQSGAIEEIDRLDRTVGSTLTIASGGRIDKRSIDLREVCEIAARNTRAAFEESEAELIVHDGGAEAVEIEGDPDALARVFLNLLRNAAQALGPGERAWLEVARADSEVVVEVRDEGRGIADGDLEQIFKPFYTTRSGGTGLGLTVTRRIVRAHGGEIEVDSEPNQGTRVRVRLPLGAGTI